MKDCFKLWIFWIAGAIGNGQSMTHHELWRANICVQGHWVCNLY